MVNKVNDIYDIYHKPVLNYIMKRVPNVFIAEDLLHDVFERVQNKIDTISDNNKIKAWVYQIAKNIVIDYYRKEATCIFIEEKLEKENEVKIENEAFQRLQLSVLEMIQLLPYIYRQALFLADYKGLPYKEIAIKQNVSLSCVKSRVQRARKKMKEIYMECCHFDFDVYGKVIDYFPRQ